VADRSGPVTIPTLTFFNNKGGVGKTSLVFHLAWMFSLMGQRVLACDFDPQANLTAAFLPEERLEELWERDDGEPNTIYRCLRPLTEVGDLRAPAMEQITHNLFLVPGDLDLSGFEDQLSQEWPGAMGSGNLYRPFRILTAFWQVAQLGARACNADLVLLDLGPNLGAINRSVLIGSTYIIFPLGADLFSLQGLRNLGPKLREWRTEWRKRRDNWPDPAFELPQGDMLSLGYVVQQHSVRLDRPAKAYDRWVNRIPVEYRRSILGEQELPSSLRPANDPCCLAQLKHYRSLIPLSQEVRKPIFSLSVADGAIGSHAAAVREAWGDFEALAQKILPFL